MIEVASLQYDVIFKKAFCQPEIFMDFVKDVLDINISITNVETEKSFSPQIGPVASRYDLFAEDKKNRIIVDIQHRRYDDHYDKFLHYHCMAMLEQVARTETYRSSVAVYTVVVLTSGDRHKKDFAIIDFDPKTRDGKNLNEIKHKIIYLCPKYADAETPEPLKSWLLAINDTLDGEVNEDIYSEKIKNIFQYIQLDKISPIERAKMKEEASANLEKIALEKDKQELLEDKQKLLEEKQKLLDKQFEILKQNIFDIIEIKYSNNNVEEIKNYINKLENIEKLENIRENIKSLNTIEELNTFLF